MAGRRRRSRRELETDAVVPFGLEAFRSDGEDQVLLAIPLPRWELPSVLSPAERDVAKALLQGLTPREIAAHRGTSLRTVQNQVRAIYDKLGVESRQDLAARCVGRASR